MPGLRIKSTPQTPEGDIVTAIALLLIGNNNPDIRLITFAAIRH